MMQSLDGEQQQILLNNEWFRDQNLQNSVSVPKGDGPDLNADYNLLRRGKRHDYFTSCLPWPEKGPGVELPIGGSAHIVGSAPVSIYGDGNIIGLYSGSTNYGLMLDPNSDSLQLSSTSYGTNLTGTPNANNLSSAFKLGLTTDATKSGIVGTLSNVSGLTADLSTASPVTINALRQAFQLQKLYERDARGGTRYTEILRSHFGVVSPDARLQRPEYLGGSSTRINVNPVPQTNSTDATSPQGNLAAYGLVSDSRGGFVKSFVEHCVIIGLVNVRADLTYQQGIPRMFSRSGRFDFYWPALAHLGGQSVLNKEIYAQGTAADDDVFGYQERWAEYRYFPSQITGQFRSTYAQTLDSWHLSQKFDALPVLNDSFVQDNPPALS